MITALLLFPPLGLLSFYILWVFYLAVMNLKRSRDDGSLTRTAYLLGQPILYLGLLIDFLVNVIVLTVLFLEFPKEYLVTSRLSRHIHDSSGYRLTLAKWFCRNLMDTFDPSGCHCK